MTREADSRGKGRDKTMRMYDLIMKKRNGEALNHEEIQYLIEEYVAEIFLIIRCLHF